MLSTNPYVDSMSFWPDKKLLQYSKIAIEAVTYDEKLFMESVRYHINKRKLNDKT